MSIRPTRCLVAALSRPEGMLQKMQARLGPYMRGNDPSPPGDEIKTRFALDILKTRKPAVHDHSLEFTRRGGTRARPVQCRGQCGSRGDRWLSLHSCLLRPAPTIPKAIALVVSDHGFVQVTHKVNLMQPFLRAGLIQSGGSWKAQPWSGAGMAAVMLHDPADLQTAGSGARFAAGPEGGSRQRHRRGAGARRHQAARRIPRRIVS